MIMEIHYHTLSNGIRIVHKEVNNEVAHCGIIVGAGSRNENDREHGLAHFLEHIFFKGTTKRKVHQVLNRLENVGGELNAFTTKEETCIYASFLSAYYNRTLDLISDILFHSTFPEKEIQKEKDVIIDEINSYKDSPYEMIYDDFEDLVFDGHPLGRNILGTKQNLRRFNQEMIKAFIRNNYSTEQMVICSVGRIKFSRLVKLTEKYFTGDCCRPRVPESYSEHIYKPARKIIRKRTYQTHCITGNTAYPYNSEKRIPMALLNNYFGGPGLNSRLNMAVREKHGIAYNNESLYTSYSDTGIFAVYLGIDNGALEKTLEYVENELKKLRNNMLGTLQLNNARRQFTGQLAIAFESNATQMLSMGKSMLLTNRVMGLKEVFETIERIKSADLLEIANEVFDPDRRSLLVYLNK